MEIPKMIIRNKRRYTFVKKYPNVVLYVDQYGFYETFQPFDLGLIPKREMPEKILPMEFGANKIY